jgi:hypothetical protein
MADSSNIQKAISKINQASTNMLMENVLKKHNVKLSGENISREQKAQLRKLVADLQNSFSKLEKLQKIQKK